MLEKHRSTAELWVEVVEPLADAMNQLASAIESAPGELGGVSIAVSEHGTLLMNQRAWLMFGESLKAIGRLRTRHTARDETKPMRFLLIAADQVPADLIPE